jgi:heat shock protein HtpX
MNSNALRLAAFFIVLTVVLLVSGHILGGFIGMVAAGAGALLLTMGMLWFSDRLVLRMAGAYAIVPDDYPWLTERVHMLTRQAQLTVPALYLIDHPTPNAFATGRTSGQATVVLTSGLFQLLTRDEVTGVIAHELAHIKQRDTLTATITALFAGILTLPIAIARHQRRLEWFLLLLLSPVTLILTRLGTSYSREYQADMCAVQMLGDPLPLASALEKIEWAVPQMPMQCNPGMASLYVVSPLIPGSGLPRFFQTHPPTTQRVARLRALAAQSCPERLPQRASHPETVTWQRSKS